MVFRKIFCCVFSFLMLSNILTVGVAAARTGEFETYFVEFKALVPDDFDEAVEIKLTHKTEGYALTYALHKINNYFSNEAVPPGEYKVEVNTPNTKNSKFKFIYEEKFIIEPLAVAVPFTVIIDNAALEGDASDSSAAQGSANNVSSEQASSGSSEKTESDNSDENSVITSIGSDVSSEVSEENVQNKEENSQSFWPSILFSLFISVLVIGIVAVVLWFIKNK